MNDINIVAVTLPHVIKLTDPEREIEIQLTLTVPDGLTLSEIEEHVNQFLKNIAVFKEKVTEFVAKKDVPIPPVIDWDVRAINEKAATYSCKKCSAMMVSQHGVSQKNNPYLVIKCPDKDCKSSFFLSWVNFVKNVKEILAWKPEWTPKNYEPIPEPVKLTIDEIATISNKTVAEIKTLAVKKREKLKGIIPFEAALNLVAKDLGVIKT